MLLFLCIIETYCPDSSDYEAPPPRASRRARRSVGPARKGTRASARLKERAVSNPVSNPDSRPSTRTGTRASARLAGMAASTPEALCYRK